MSIMNIRVYTVASEIANEVASIVGTWESMHKRTLGEQLIRAADSISNNISEGYGRTSTGERIQFFMYSDASLSETRNCLKLAYGRQLIDEDTNARLQKKLRGLSISIVEFANAYLERDPRYQGPFRERIAKRRAWLKKPSEKSASDSKEPL
jgi:four helix bundle protein